jgi:hypothetical protein
MNCKGKHEVFPAVLYFVLFTSCTCEYLTEIHNNIAESIFFTLLSIPFAFTFEKEHVFPPGKSWYPCSAATGTRHFAVPPH